jgi:hypothetical protein
MHPQSFGKNGQNGGQQSTTNGQASATASVSAPQIPAPQQDVAQNAFMDENNMVRGFPEISSEYQAN